MERKGRPLSHTIDLGTASIVPLIAIGAEVLFQFIVIALSLPETARNWVVIVGNQIVFFLTCFVFVRFRRIDLAELTGVKRVPKIYFFPLFALVAVLCVFTFAPLAGLFSSLLRKMGYHYAPNYFVPFDNVGLFILALLGLTVLPAIGEETLMRGVLLSGAKRKSPFFAICFTSLVFALFHGNLVQLVHQFLLGAVMAYLVLLTRSIWASAAVHAVNNAAALTVEYLYVNGSIGGDAYGYFTADFSKGLSVGAFVAIFLASLVLLAGTLVVITYLIKCARSRARVSQGAPERQTLREMLTDPQEETVPAEDPFAGYGKYFPIFLVAALVLLLVSNVVSEALK